MYDPKVQGAVAGRWVRVIADDAELPATPRQAEVAPASDGSAPQAAAPPAEEANGGA
jgi:hypothetical protein